MPLSSPTNAILQVWCFHFPSYLFFVYLYAIAEYLCPNDSQFIYWNCNPQCISIGRWGLWKVMRSWGQISALRKRHRGALSSSLCRGRYEKAAVWDLREAITRTNLSGTLTSGFSASRTARNKFPLFTSHPICSTLSQTPRLTRTPINTQKQLWN